MWHRRTGRGNTPACVATLLCGLLLVAACDFAGANQPGANTPSPSPPAARTPDPDSTLATIEERVVARYLAFWDVVTEAADPPNPDHPELEKVAADPMLSQLRETFAEYRDQGRVRRGDDRSHPRIREFVDAGAAVIIDDCVELDPEGGLYDAETGELISGGGEPGERQLTAARLEISDGTWKVVGLNVVEEHSECDPADF